MRVLAVGLSGVLAACSGAPTGKDDCVPVDRWVDADGDGAGDPARPASACPDEPGYAEGAGDCDDADADVAPGLPEACDGKDQDCDDDVDEGVLGSWYHDGDSDGFGAGDPIAACSPPSGAVAEDGDCDDTDADAYPGSVEVCDGVDQDCAFGPDNSLVFETFWPDGDGDGFGDAEAAPVSTCDGTPPGYVAAAGDCDDGDPDANPDGVEVCDGVDQDCDGSPDDGLPGVDAYPDADQDGYGAEVPPLNACAEMPEGYVTVTGDCDDGDPGARPDALEVCDGVDQDCDGTADDGLPTVDYWYDADGDGYGDDAIGAIAVCGAQPAGTVDVGGDCDDAASAVHPGGDASGCDRVDSDCDGVIEELRVPEDYAEVQDAVVAAGSGALVCVAAGTYGPVHATLAKTDLRLVGEPGATISGQGVTGALQWDACGGEVSGFTVRDGEAVLGAGVFVNNGSCLAPAWLHDLVVTENRCSDPTFCEGTGVDTWGPTHLEDVVVTGNVALGNQASGAAVAFSYASVTFEGLVVSGNEGTGAGVSLISGYGPPGSVVGVDLEVTDNVVPSTGGLFSLASQHVDLRRVLVQGNVGAGGLGWIAPDDGILANWLVLDNVTTGYPWSLGVSASHFTIANNDFGASAVIEDAGGGSLSDSVIANNTAATPYYVWTTATWNDFWASGTPPAAVGQSGNIALDPLVQADGRLGVGSPAIDAGDPGVSDPDGTRADQGAYGGPDAFP